MGMARASFSRLEDEDKKHNKSFSANIIGYITDVALGFFVFPFLYFILNTTVEIVEKPSSITHGVAILYIALLTSIFYLLSKKAFLTFENRILNYIFIVLGLIIFFLSFYLLQEPNFTIIKI